MAVLQARRVGRLSPVLSGERSTKAVSPFGFAIPFWIQRAALGSRVSTSPSFGKKQSFYSIFSKMRFQRQSLWTSSTKTEHFIVKEHLSVKPFAIERVSTKLPKCTNYPRKVPVGKFSGSTNLKLAPPYVTKQTKKQKVDAIEASTFLYSKQSRNPVPSLSTTVSACSP